MPVSRTRTLNLANYANGTRNLPETALPDSVTSLVIEIARCTTADPTIWPNRTTRLTFLLEYTLDGTNWVSWMEGTGIEGGIDVHNKTGEEFAYTTFSAGIPEGTGRKVRGSLTITGGPLRATAFITLVSP